MTLSNSKNELLEWTNHPVLIYGPRKSGTTMLQKLHDGGEHLLCFPDETKLKRLIREPDPISSFSSKTYYSLNQTEFLKSIMRGKEYPNFNAASYRQLVKSIQNSDLSSLKDILRHDIFAVYQSIIQKPSNLVMWGMKEIGGDTKRIIQLFKELFPNGKIVMIVRNPLLVTRSVLTNRRRKGDQLNTNSIIREIIDPIEVLYQQSQFLDDPNIYFVSYEKITGGYLKENMMGICKYLGIPYSDIHTQTTTFGESIVVSSSSKVTTKVFRNKAKWYDGLTSSERKLVVLYHKNFYHQKVKKNGKEIYFDLGYDHLTRMDGAKLTYSEIIAQMEKRS